MRYAIFLFTFMLTPTKMAFVIRHYTCRIYLLYKGLITIFMGRTIHIPKEIAVSYISFVAAFAMYVLSIIFLLQWITNTQRPTIWFYMANGLFFLLISSFAYGNILYQLTRIGYYTRLRTHAKTHDLATSIEYAIHDSQQASLSILIPSYKEELITVQQTLISAALMGYRNKRIALLLDDPDAAPETPDHRHTQKTIAMVKAIERSFAKPRTVYATRYRTAHQRMATKFDLQHELQYLSESYTSLARWFNNMGNRYPTKTHTDQLFVEKVFYEAAQLYTLLAEDTKTVECAGDAEEAREYLLEEHAYLRDMFSTQIQVMQRKQFANLSQEPNKAMNINSYLSLMGGAYTITKPQHKKPYLSRTNQPEQADIIVPETDYVITLDADSIIDHRYAATLIEMMERPEHTRVAVAQTPYSSIAGTRNILERTAGATTDIQYIIHQGFTGLNATYWVGANALIRKRALDDIAEPLPNEPLVKQYIQDRTVIEDTESSIDLVNKGWSLHNHPERLAYSATPVDYGSLLIQRRRWANGGLIILPKLLRYLFVRPSIKKVPEGFVRIHYLASIAMVNTALVIMLVIPLEDVGFSIWVPLTALPYFYLYYRDLRLLGYTFGDLLRVYALNLLLIPINLGGVLKSLQQLATGAKIPFGRTPKIGSRTAAPPLYHILNYSILGYLVFLTISDLLTGMYLYASLLLINIGFMGYALIAFVGTRASIDDLKVLPRRLFKKKLHHQAQESLQPNIG